MNAPKRNVLSEIFRTLRSYVRGQLLVALWMIVLYAVGFALLNVPGWPFVAIICGSLHVVPTLGAALGLLIPVTVSLIAGRGLHQILGIIGVFVGAQLLETFYLTPKVVGSHVRIRPLVVFLALLAGGLLFGFIGALVAVPAVAVAMVIWRAFHRTEPPDTTGH
jgi:predicted PurR-regulated permease PerM